MKVLLLITVKRHRLKPIERVSGLILVENDSVEATVSYSHPHQSASNDALLADYKWWSELCQFFDNSRRLLIGLEDIFSASRAWIAELVNLLGLTPSAAEIDAYVRAVRGAKTVLTRMPESKSSTTYREKLPQQVVLLDVPAEGNPTAQLALTRG